MAVAFRTLIGNSKQIYLVFSNIIGAIASGARLRFISAKYVFMTTPLTFCTVDDCFGSGVWCLH